MNKPGLGNRDIATISIGIANIWLVLSCLILLPYLLAPLLGGKFLPMALLKYGVWIVNALILKYAAKYFRDRIRMKKQKWFILSIWLILSIIVWHPNYIGLIISLFSVIFLIVGFRSQKRAGWINESRLF